MPARYTAPKSCVRFQAVYVMLRLVSFTPSPVIELVPLDAATVRERLVRDDFFTTLVVAGTAREVHFGPEFPGDALVMYEHFLGAVDTDGIVPGSFVIVDVEAGEAVGQIGTKGEPRGDVEIGYGVNRSVEGRGIATAAVGTFVAILRANPDVTGITAHTATTNPASARVLEKNGFTRIGTTYDEEDGDLTIWRHRS